LGLGDYVARIDVIGGTVKETFKFRIENKGRTSEDIEITKL